jgi:hypothetical protein
LADKAIGDPKRHLLLCALIPPSPTTPFGPRPEFSGYSSIAAPIG